MPALEHFCRQVQKALAQGGRRFTARRLNALQRILDIGADCGFWAGGSTQIVQGDQQRIIAQRGRNFLGLHVAQRVGNSRSAGQDGLGTLRAGQRRQVEDRRIERTPGCFR